jgi:hypothetical protein
VLKRDGRDLVEQFRALAPPRPPIPLQRWGALRVVMAVGLLLLAVLVAQNIYGLFSPADLPIADAPTCGSDDVMILMAQSVPTAGSVPCIAALPAGWSADDVEISQDRGRFSVKSSDRTVDVALRPPGDCATLDLVEVATDRDGLRRFEPAAQPPPGSQTTRTYLTDGGCITYDFVADASVVPALDALSFQSRRELVATVERRTGLSLCGAFAAPCVGGS